MIESVSRRFLELLDPLRDGIYAMALSAGGSDQVEVILQRAVRRAYRAYVNGLSADENVAERLRQFIQDQTAPSAGSAAPGNESPAAMPADTWARLAAAVQIEAARLGGAAEQSMLAYDPLLAPQKRPAPGEEPIEGLNLSPWTRFVITTAIVLIIGIVASIMLTTRHEPAVATQGHGPNATQPATATAPASSHGPRVP